MNDTSLIPVLKELERYASWADDELGLHQNQRTVITIQTRGQRKTELGHFWPDRWSDGTVDEIHEISLSAEELKRDTHAILATLHHELVHLFNHQSGMKDCSKSGRHNKIFKQSAEDYGLEVAEPHKSKGYAFTSLTDDLTSQIDELFRPDEAAFKLYRTFAPSKTNKPPQKRVKWLCACPTTVMVAKDTNLIAECRICGEDFLKEG